MLEQLGEGAHGVVVRAQPKADPHRSVAIKRVPVKPNQILPLAILREIKCLQQLSEHSNIVRLESAFAHGSAYALVFEYIPHDLSQIIKALSEQRTLPPLHVKTWVHMLLSGVKHIHAIGIAHRVRHSPASTRTSAQPTEELR